MSLVFSDLNLAEVNQSPGSRTRSPLLQKLFIEFIKLSSSSAAKCRAPFLSSFASGISDGGKRRRDFIWRMRQPLEPLPASSSSSAVLNELRTRCGEFNLWVSGGEVTCLEWIFVPRCFISEPGEYQCKTGNYSGAVWGNATRSS